MMVPLMKWEYTPAESEKWRNISVMIVLLMKYKYALPDNRKWREHVSRYCVANGMELRSTHCVRFVNVNINIALCLNR